MLDPEIFDNVERAQLSARYLTAEDCNIAASVLYQAYHDEDLFKHILGFNSDNPTSYEKKLRLLIREELSSFWQNQQHIIGVFEGTNLLAVSCVLKLNSDFSANRVWHWRLKLMLNTGLLSTKQLIAKETRIREVLRDYSNLCFINLFAVDPHVQQQGLGRYLLRAVDDIVNTENAQGSAIFVTQSQHLSLFESEGYVPLQTLSINSISGELLIKKK